MNRMLFRTFRRAAALLLFAVSAALATPGDLDPDFGGTGKVTTDFSGGGDFAYGVAVQSDGKVVVAGYTGTSNRDFAVARYNSNGTLDTSFGIGGKASTLIGNYSEECYGVAIQSDGKIVLAGYSGSTAASSSYDFAAVRYNADGTLDTSFGDSGRVVTDFGGDKDVGQSVAIQSDGKIVVAGYATVAGKTMFAVAKYTTGGALDTSFNTSGKVTTAIGSGNDNGFGVAIQTDGKIVVTGRSDSGSNTVVAVARYETDGSLDANFGSGGKITTAVGTQDLGRCVTVQSDGKIVVAGQSAQPSNDDFLMIRYNANGTLDSGFGEGGKLTSAISSTNGNDDAFSVAVQGDEKILVAGFSDNGGNWDFAVIRITAAGGKDVTFGGGSGIVTTPIGSGSDYAFSMALQSDGKIVLAGYSSNGANNDFALVRYDTSGTRDSGFGGGGKLTTAIGSGDDRAYSMALQNDGKIVVAGFSANAGNRDFAVARYSASGTLDDGFGVGGKVQTAIGSGEDIATSVVLQSDGKILAAGYALNGSKRHFALVRYNLNGSLDTSLNTSGKVVTVLGTDESFCYAVAVQSDGKIVTAGYSYNGSNSDFAVVRYNPDGSLDPSFGGTGKVATGLGANDDFASSMALQADGKIIVGGYSYNASNFDFALVRYKTDGSLDTSFGNNGIVTTPVGSTYDHAYGVAVQQSDGKIVIVGDSGNGNDADIALVRYTPTGVLDSSFGGGGKVTTPIGSSSEEGYAMALQGDGKIVVAGYAVIGGKVQLALVRYLDTGGLDSGFGSGGKVTTPIGGNTDYGHSVAVQSDGRIVVAGSSSNGSNDDFALVRYLGTVQPPMVVTGGSSGISKTAATVNGAVNPNSAAATAFFQYGKDINYGTATPGQNIGSGGLSIAVQATFSGLEPNTPYHYRLVASNSAGTTFGDDAIFTTAPDPPVVATGDAAEASNTLLGAVNPNGRATDVRFEYGSTALYGTLTPVQHIPAGTTVVDVNAQLTGLVVGATYHYRIIASNSGGVAMPGEDKTFKATDGTGGTGGGATAMPVVTTGSATGLGSHDVILQGTVNPKGGTTLAYFEYGETASYGSQTTPQGVGNGPDPIGYSMGLSGLQTGTTYHFRFVASNSLGTRTGADAMFTTLFDPPSATTDAAEIGTTFATLHGMVNPNGVATTVSFAYGTSPTLAGATTVPVQGGLTGVSDQAVSLILPGLSPETQYYYRVIASSSAGQTLGTVVGLTTLDGQTPTAVTDNLFVGSLLTPASVDLLANDVNRDFPPTTNQDLSFVTFLLDRPAPVVAQGSVSGDGNVTYTRFGAFRFDTANFPPTPSDVFGYRITTPGAKTADGTVNVYHYGSFKGSFGGVISGGSAIDGGAMTLELAASGDFTMRLAWQGVDYSRKPQFNGAGEIAGANGRLSIAKLNGATPGKNLFLTLRLQPDGTIPGTLLDEESGKMFPFTLRRAGLAAPGDPSFELFTATMDQVPLALAEDAPRDGISPQAVTGFGFYLAKLSKSRSKVNARLAGGMPDQEPFSSGSKVFADRVLLNQRLYKKGRGFGGRVFGEATLARAGSFTSTLEWIKQTGLLNAPPEVRSLRPRANVGVPGFLPFDFHNAVSLAGDSYQRAGDLPATQRFLTSFGSTLEVRFSAGGLASEQTAVFTLRQAGAGFRVLTGATTFAAKPTFKVDPATGKFSGSFTHPGNATETYPKPVKFSGAFRRNPDASFDVGEKGRGSFRGFSNAGYVRVYKVQ